MKQIWTDESIASSPRIEPPVKDRLTERIHQEIIFLLILTYLFVTVHIPPRLGRIFGVQAAFGMAGAGLPLRALAMRSRA
jgi:hypothetical protein